MKQVFFLRKVIVPFFLSFIFLCSCAPTEQSGADNKLVIWHWMTDRKDAFSELASRYTDETGIAVEFKLFFPPDIYSQKVIAAARAGNLPDIFGILGEKKTIASFVSGGYLLDLGPAMDQEGGAWRKSFYPQTLDVVVFQDDNTYNAEPGVYGVPIDTTLMQFIYNRTLFEKSGLDKDAPPQTFEEFITFAKTIKEKTGVDGFVCGWGEGWLLNALCTEWAINRMGMDAFLKTIDGDIRYDSSEWIEVFTLFGTLKDSGILSNNIATMMNKEAEDAFSKGKAAFSFNGSWSVNVYKQLNPKLDYAFFSLPKVSNKFPVTVWGGAGSSFMVNAKSSQKDAAAAFLRWMTLPAQQEFLIKETNNLPSIKMGTKELPAVLKTAISDLDNLTHPNVWPRNEDSRVLEVMNRGLQQIVLGIRTPLEVAKEVQNTKERIARR